MCFFRSLCGRVAVGVLGGSSCETVLVDRLGSLHLTAPLAHAHMAGEAVVVQQNTSPEPGLGETQPNGGQTEPHDGQAEQNGLQMQPIVDQAQPSVDQVLLTLTLTGCF